MTTFLDKKNRTWKVELDAFALDDVRQQTGVDLADLSGTGYATVASNVVYLVKVLAVLCSDQIKAATITDRDFAKGIIGSVIEDASNALLVAAQNFFPPKTWSVIQRCSKQVMNRKEAATSAADLAEVMPLIAMLKTLPDEMRQGAMAEMRAQMKAAGADDSDLQTLEQLASAGASTDSTPSSPAIDSPVNAEQQHAA